MAVGVRVCSWGLCAFSLSHRSVFVPAPPCFEYCCSVVCAVWEGYVSCFVLGSQYWLGNSVSCMLPHNIRISGSNSVKNIIGNLIFIVFFTLISKSLRPVDCSLPGSSVHVISQASILEWVAISYSRRSSQPWS